MKVERKYVWLGLIVIMVLVGPTLFLIPYGGGWELNTTPISAYEHNLAKEKSFSAQYFSDYTHGVEFDASYSGAPNIKLFVSRWVHTDGRLSPDPRTGFKTAYETPWERPYDTFQIKDVPVLALDESGEQIYTDDGTPVYKTTTVAYDLHLFFQQVQIVTSADVKKVGEGGTFVNHYIFDHETAYSEHTRNGDLGAALDLTIQLKVGLDIFPIRTIPTAVGYETETRAGIMKLSVEDYSAGDSLNDALKEQATKGDLDWSNWIQGNVAEGSPQGGDMPMFWVDTPGKFQPTSVTEETPGLPRVLPTELIVNLHAKLRAGYILGYELTGFNELRDVIPVDQWINFGIMMEVLTIRDFWIYSDPYGNYLEPSETWRRGAGEEEPDPGLFEKLGDAFAGLGDFINNLMPWNNLKIFLGLAIVGIVVFMILKRSPQFKMLQLSRRLLKK